MKANHDAPSTLTAAALQILAAENLHGCGFNLKRFMEQSLVRDLALGKRHLLQDELAQAQGHIAHH